jgi:hypothetical protein
VQVLVAVVEAWVRTAVADRLLCHGRRLDTSHSAFP